jgi:hypothetical protein
MNTRHTGSRRRGILQLPGIGVCRAAASILLSTALLWLPGSARPESDAAPLGASSRALPAGPALRSSSMFASSLVAQSASAVAKNPTHSNTSGLARPDSWGAALDESARSGEPVVVLFSTPGCAFCEFVRRDHLRHLAKAEGPRGLQVFELSLVDREPFRESGAAASSPAALAASLGIRFAPTVAFFGPEGEVAQRLVGYASADFYGAYLDDRIEIGRKAIEETLKP